MFLCRFPKTAFKNTQNSLLYSILKLTFLGIFKIKVFVFLNFLEILFCFSFFKSILYHCGLLDMFPCTSSKTALQNTYNSLLYNILKLTILGIFKNENFRFFQFSRTLFNDLWLGFSDRATYMIYPRGFWPQQSEYEVCFPFYSF